MVEKQNTVFGSVKKPYEKPYIEVFELDNKAPLLAGSPSGKATFGTDHLEDDTWSDD